MSTTQVLDRPVEYLDEGAPIIDDTTDMDNPNGFPESLYLVDIGNGRYGALNISPHPIIPGDEYKVGAIATFANQSEGRLYQEKYNQPGEIVNKPFKEVLEIAISKKPVISAIALQHEGRTILVQYIN